MIDVFCSQNQHYFDFWKSLPRDGLVPKISSFHPEEIHRLLTSFTVYELVSTDCILIRKGGSAIELREDYEQKGDNYLDLVAPERREKAGGAFFAMYKQPCGMRVIMRHTLKNGKYIILEGMGLPFINDKGGSPLVYISNHEIADPAPHYLPGTEDSYKGMLLLQRDFIDIGAGLADYQD